MVTYTKAELLAWLKDQSRMQRWDVIITLAREPTNALLLQQYIESFNRDSYWSGIGGQVSTGAGEFIEAISDFTLGVPRLFYEDTGLDSSKANLEMAIVEGMQVSLQKKSDRWVLTRVHEYSPTEGPKLFLDLLLADVQGRIDGDRRIRLDLRKSSHFRLTFAQTPLEQEQGGDYFQKLFEQLDEEQRVWAIGEIKEGKNPMLRPQSFGLRTQQGGTEGAGAILVFVRMQGRNEGVFPGLNSGFRYLIPRDAGKDYSTAILISRGRVLMGQLLASFGDLIGDHDFQCVFDDDNDWTRATATGGKLDIPGDKVVTKGINFVDLTGEAWADVESEFDGFSMLADQRLVLERKGDEVTARWAVSGSTDAHSKIVDCSLPLLKERSLGKSSVGYSISVLATYELVDDAQGGSVRLKSISYETDADADVAGAQADRAVLAEQASKTGEAFFILVFLVYLSGLTVSILTSIAAAMLKSPMVKGAIESALSKNFPSALTVRDFIKENIELYFGAAIVDSEVHSPGDVGCFGRVNPGQTCFAITTPEPQLAAGASHSFRTQPVINGLQWTVEDLRRSSRNPGSINPSSGVYQAPRAEQIDGGFTRVRVTASDPTTSFRSSALVTVVADPLTINPLISTCRPEERMRLTIGVLGDGPVEARVRNPGPGSGTLERVEGGYRYVAAPKVDKETYVLDEIVATYDGQAHSAYILVEQFTPGVTVWPVAAAAQLPSGQIQLKAEVNDHDVTALCEWLIPFNGPGQMDANIPGRYHADANADAHFVCIIAVYENVVLGVYKGHTILPLPLAKFANELQMLSDR
ncbi:hypothetical protein [Pseudomonas sp. MWU13-2105]|uniref:hypothetical protein n=1 Tax=Pseudomonas sp. MWU13-2105 TaxID=2935074 RepID=UPI00200EA7E5|nr:hypothetical protein [Pseudomonas sp. MWU13-2105]